MLTDDKLQELEAAEKRVELIHLCPVEPETASEAFRINCMQTADIWDCDGVALSRNQVVFYNLARNHLRQLIDEVKAHRSGKELLANKRHRDEAFAENQMLKAQLDVAVAALKKISQRGAGPLQHRLEVDEALAKIEAMGVKGE